MSYFANTSPSAVLVTILVPYIITLAGVLVICGLIRLCRGYGRTKPRDNLKPKPESRNIAFVMENPPNMPFKIKFTETGPTINGTMMKFTVSMKAAESPNVLAKFIESQEETENQSVDTTCCS